MPEILNLAESASGKRPQTVAIITDNTGASVASVKPTREGLLQRLGLKLVVDETFTPPIADATPLVQKVRASRPDLFFSCRPSSQTPSWCWRKSMSSGWDRERCRSLCSGIAIAMPDMLNTVSADLLQGVLTCVGNWGVKGEEQLIADLKAKYNTPWANQNTVSTYGDMWIIKEALEKAGKADRAAVAEALRTMDGGPAKYFPGGQIKFDEKGRRVGAGLTVVQWQSGLPTRCFRPSSRPQSRFGARGPEGPAFNKRRYDRSLFGTRLLTLDAPLACSSQRGSAVEPH